MGHGGKGPNQNFCYQIGHSGGRGMSRPYFQNFGGNYMNKPHCQVCGKFGHIALNCYHQFDHNYQATESNHTTSLTS